jgi:hypothetical protein
MDKTILSTIDDNNKRGAARDVNLVNLSMAAARRG